MCVTENERQRSSWFICLSDLLKNLRKVLKTRILRSSRSISSPHSPILEDGYGEIVFYTIRKDFLQYLRSRYRCSPYQTSSFQDFKKLLLELTFFDILLSFGYGYIRYEFLHKWRFDPSAMKPEDSLWHESEYRSLPSDS